MAQYRTAMGKSIDMDKVRSQQGDTRAVGNMSVNARGDILDSHNRVVNDSSKRVNKMYQNAMINSGKLPRRVDVPQNVAQQPLTPDVAPIQQIVSAPPPVVDEPEFLDEDLEIEFGDDEPVGKEQPKTNNSKKS